MEKYDFDGYAVTVFRGYDGASMYINNPQGLEVYKAKFSGDATAHFFFLLSIYNF